ncbi:hypothetical protein EBQ93_01675 [bacterium]|nr:hypothetical protein [bacterium]
MKNVKYIILSMHIALCMGLFGAAGGGGAAGGLDTVVSESQDPKVGVSRLPRMSEETIRKVYLQWAMRNERSGYFGFAAEMYEIAGDVDAAQRLYRAQAEKYERDRDFHAAAVMYEKTWCCGCCTKIV